MSQIPRSSFSSPTVSSRLRSQQPPPPHEAHKYEDDATSLVSQPSVAPTERVNVIVRVKPPPLDAPGTNPVQLETGKPKKLTLHRPDAPVQATEFSFDRVLGPDATQQDVYMAGVKDVVEDVLKGYNGTVMAYGQTGSGKTYTLGNVEPHAIGMIARCAAEIFYQASIDPSHTYSVSMSYIQIYMELIQDLLNPQSENLNIREDTSNGVFVAGVQEVPVKSLEECLHYQALGEQNRAFAFTHLNAHSSRSHAVVMLTVVKRRRYLTPAEKQAEKKAEREGILTHKVKVGKLYLVDLAGSERLKKSKSVGQRATEARSINLSLTTLGMCISARAADDKHVPFRDSKLTRLLQESLGGNAKTTLLVNVAGVQEHIDETLQSLQFASRAMCVKNKPIVNERVDYRILHAELQSRMDQENDRASQLEAVLIRKDEELDESLQEAIRQEKARYEALAESLRKEGEQRVARVSSQLEGKAREVAAHEQAARSKLEQRIKKLEAEKVSAAESHYSHTAALNAQLADLLERQAAEATANRKQAEAAAAQIKEAKAVIKQKEAANKALQAQISDMAFAHLSMLASMSKLQSCLEATIPGGPEAAATGADVAAAAAAEVSTCVSAAQNGMGYADSDTPAFRASDQGAERSTNSSTRPSPLGPLHNSAAQRLERSNPGLNQARSVAATFGSGTLTSLDTLRETSAFPGDSSEGGFSPTRGLSLSQGLGVGGAEAANADGDGSGREDSPSDPKAQEGLAWAPQTAEAAATSGLHNAASANSLEAISDMMARSSEAAQSYAAPLMPPLRQPSSPSCLDPHASSSPTLPHPQHLPSDRANNAEQGRPGGRTGVQGAGEEQANGVWPVSHLRAEQTARSHSLPSSPAGLPLSAFNVHSSPAFDVSGVDRGAGAGRPAEEDEDGIIETFGQQLARKDGDPLVVLQEVQQRMTGMQALAEHVQAEVEAEQESTHSKLEATKAELDATQQELAEVQLESVNQAATQGSRTAELEEQIRELQEHSKRLQEKLDNEVTSRTTAEGTFDSYFNTQTELQHARALARKRMNAALTIQCYYRRWRDRSGLQHRSAQMGAALVCDSMISIRDGLNAIVTAFLGRTKNLEAQRTLSQRIANAVPVLSQQQKQQQGRQSQRPGAEQLGPLANPHSYGVYVASLQDTHPHVQRKTSSGLPSKPSAGAPATTATTSAARQAQ